MASISDISKYYYLMESDKNGLCQFSQSHRYRSVLRYVENGYFGRASEQRPIGTKPAEHRDQASRAGVQAYGRVESLHQPVNQSLQRMVFRLVSCSCHAPQCMMKQTKQQQEDLRLSLLGANEAVDGCGLIALNGYL